MGIFGTIAMVMAHIMALEAGHAFLQPVDTPFDALVLALVLVGHASTVAGHAGVFNGSDFLDLVARDQATEGEIRSADVALATRGMASVTVVVKRFFHVRVAEIGPTGGQHGLIAG